MGVVDTIIGIAQLVWLLLRLPFAILYDFYRTYFAPEKSIDKEVVLITGAGSGIGKGMAEAMAAQGATILLLDINGAAVEAAADEINTALGAKVAHAYQCDITQPETVYNVINDATAKVGPVDILINNAGIVTGKKILECPDSMIEKTLQVNAISHFWTIKAVLPSMLTRNHGHIVSIASSAARAGVPGLIDYCASKSAAFAIDESLRMELRHRGATGVHTTCICPFFIDTGMFAGAKTKWPLLLPILKPDYAVKKIMRAIRTNDPLLYMPRFIYLGDFLRAITPTSLIDEALDWLGVTESMDDFKGRGQDIISNPSTPTTKRRAAKKHK